MARSRERTWVVGSEQGGGLLYFPNIPKVKTVVFLVKYQNPTSQDPSNPLRNTLVCRHFLISFLKSSHQKIIFQISVGIFAQTAHFGNCQNLENVYNVFSENTPLKKCPYPIFLIENPTFLVVPPHIHCCSSHCCSSDGGDGGGDDGRIFQQHQPPPHHAQGYHIPFGSPLTPIFPKL